MGMALALAAPAFADTEKPHRSPVNAMPYYWFRTERGVPGPLVAADPRLAEMATALSGGELARCRELAQSILDSTDSPDLHAEASAYVVESYLAEGDFAGARASAERMDDAQSLRRVGKLESAYNAEVSRLQRIVATTKDGELTVRALLGLGVLHEATEDHVAAREAYVQAITECGTAPSVITSARRLLALCQTQGGAAATSDAARWLLVVRRDSPAVCLAAARSLATALAMQLGAEEAAAEVGAALDASEGDGARAALLVALAEVYEAAGHLAEARSTYRDLAMASPDLAGELQTDQRMCRLLQAAYGNLERLAVEAQGDEEWDRITREARSLLSEVTGCDSVAWPLRALLAETIAQAGGRDEDALEAGIAELAALMSEMPASLEAVAAYRTLGLLLLESGREEDATKVWEAAAVTCSDSPLLFDTLMRLGDLYVRRGDMGDALRMYDRAISSPDAEIRGWGHVHKARAYESQTRLGEALAEYHAAADQSPVCLPVYEAREAIARLEKEGKDR